MYLSMILPDDVESQAFRRFVRHFDAVLQNCNREFGRRVTGQPQAEVGMRLVRVQLLTQLYNHVKSNAGYLVVITKMVCDYVVMIRKCITQFRRYVIYAFSRLRDVTQHNAGA